jgi:hypothetical protein
VKFEDWIFALDDRSIMNRSYIQKFGLDVAEVTIFMEAAEPQRRLSTVTCTASAQGAPGA